jgi:hypothetical protein
VHDFNPPSSFEEDGGPSDEDSGEEEYLGYVPGSGILWPWPRVHRLVAGAGPSGDLWPALAATGGGVVWSAAMSCRGHRHGRACHRHILVAQPTSMACTLSSSSV